MTLRLTEEDEEIDALDEAAYIMGSRYRTVVVADLAEKPTTPSQIANRHEIAISHVSRALSELSERGIVQAHSGESRTKLYSLTEVGNEVAEIVRDLDDGGEDDD